MKRIIIVICTLAERGLSFIGGNERFGSNNGNYLDLLELIAKFDSFLLAHINRYRNLIRKSLLFVKNYLRRDDSTHGQKS